MPTYGQRSDTQSQVDEHKDINDKLDEVLRILNGNGETGMCAKVNLLWTGSLFVIGVLTVTAIKAFLS